MQPTDPVAVTLEARQWNEIILALAEQPWRTANPLILEIGRQANAAEAIPAPPPAPVVTNGADHHAPD